MIKEPYYTEKTLNSKAMEFVNKLQEFRDKHCWKLQKNKVALLVIDMQEFFLQKDSHAFIPSAPAIIKPIKQLQNLFLLHDLAVFHTQHGSNDTNMLKWWDSVLYDDDPLAEICPTLINPKIPVIHKTQYDAFYHTNLANQLKEKSITQLLIAGVITHLCCETTARNAFIHGFETFLLVDATATYNESFQRAAMLNLSHGFAVPILCHEAIASLGVTHDI
jgi:isochorismate hydrolase